MSDPQRSKEMEKVANSLKKTAEALEYEAISVKHDGKVEHPDYLQSVYDEALEELELLEIEP